MTEFLKLFNLTKILGECKIRWLHWNSHALSSQLAREVLVVILHDWLHFAMLIYGPLQFSNEFKKWEQLFWVSKVLSFKEAKSSPINTIHTFSPMFPSCKSSVTYVAERSCIPWRVSFTFKNLPEIQSMNSTWMVWNSLILAKWSASLPTCRLAGMQSH